LRLRHGFRQAGRSPCDPGRRARCDQHQRQLPQCAGRGEGCQTAVVPHHRIDGRSRRRAGDARRYSRRGTLERDGSHSGGPHSMHPHHLRGARSQTPRGHEMSGVAGADERSHLLDLIDRCAAREVWIVGDLMLDEYVQGAVERVSPEAPVPVVRAGAVQYRLGGAANVARQVAALGARAVLGGAVGEDEAGDRIIEECRRAGIDTGGVVRDAARRTTRKLRVLGQQQQLVRLDWEDAHSCDVAVARALCERMASGSRPDVVILSDYAKGVLSDACLAEVIRMASVERCRVIVDPKRKDLAAYRGASLLTPNLAELSQAAGRRLDPRDLESIGAAARPFIEAAELEGILVTLSEHGMLFVGADGAENHIPAVPRAVADVTGAGDTVVAVL